MPAPSTLSIVSSYYLLLCVCVSNLPLSLFLKNFHLFLATLGLCCCVRTFSSCSEWGLLLVAVHGHLIAVASLVAEHGLEGAQTQ